MTATLGATVIIVAVAAAGLFVFGRLTGTFPAAASRTGGSAAAIQI
jgi:hypothetical protein